MQNTLSDTTAAPEIYQGQFGDFTITEGDRQSVIIYRAGLMVAALCLAVGTGLALWQPTSPVVQQSLSFLFSGFTLGLGVSLLSIHIYLALLHRVLQGFWVIGTVGALAIAHFYPEYFVVSVYEHPLTLLGVGFTFAALTGIFFKEAFCFNRLETKLLTPLVPFLLLGHLSGLIPVATEQILLSLCAILMLVFALRKAFQPIPPDIGDKSVFEHLRQSHG